MPQFGTFGTRFCTSPRHDGRRSVHIAAQQFIPADDASPVFGEVLLHLRREPALQERLGALLVISLETQVTDALLAQRTFLPAHTRRFVTADVDILAGEELHHLVEDILDKLERMVFTHAQDIIGHAPQGPHFIRTSCASQLGIGGHGCHHVAGHVNFRDNGDIAIGSIADDVTNFLLRVESAIADTVVYRRIVTQGSAVAPASHLGQAGIFLDFHTPTLVIGQVPVQTVHAMQSQQVNIALYRRDREEVTHTVQVHPAIGETRI